MPSRTRPPRRAPNPAERKHLLETLRRELDGASSTGWRHSYSADVRERIRDGLFFSEDPRWKFRFAFMLGLSVTIAVMGLLTNSTAVVIGAMLVAPLMTPVLGLSYCLSAAWGSKISASLLRVGLATAGAIAWAWALGAVFGEDPLLSSEALARTSPNLKDLVVGLAAGGAGAYATLRDDGSAALPGVGVAVALVPPLAVVGLMLEAGEPSLAWGAFLLYMANLGSIVLSAILVWLGSGFVTSSRVRSRWAPITTGILLTLVVTLGLSFVLRDRTLSAQREAELVAQERSSRETVENVVAGWLAGSAPDASLEIDAIAVGDEEVVIDLIGSGDPPPPTELDVPLSAALGREVAARIRLQLRTERAGEPLPEPVPTDEELAVGRAAPLVEAWLEAAEETDEYKVRSIDVSDGVVTVELAGTAFPPPVGDLENRLTDEFGAGFVAEIDYTPTLRATPTTIVDDVPPTDAELATTATASWIAEQIGGTDAEGRTAADTADTDPQRGPDLDVSNVEVLTDRVVVDLTGGAVPGTDALDVLRSSIVEAIGYDAVVVVRFSPRTTIELAPPTTIEADG